VSGGTNNQQVGKGLGVGALVGAPVGAVSVVVIGGGAVAAAGGAARGGGAAATGGGTAVTGGGAAAGGGTGAGWGQAAAGLAAQRAVWLALVNQLASKLATMRNLELALRDATQAENAVAISQITALINGLGQEINEIWQQLTQFGPMW